mgnify:FL=1
MVTGEEWGLVEGWGIRGGGKVWAAWGIEEPETGAVKENIAIGNGAGCRMDQVRR